MLAQNFKSAAELEITEQEHRALISVLGMLERGELVHTRAPHRSISDKSFNMNACLICIGGYAARNMGLKDDREIYRYVQEGRSSSLYPLYYTRGDAGSVTTDEAATAIRRFMIGDEPWDHVTLPAGQMLVVRFHYPASGELVAT